MQNLLAQLTLSLSSKDEAIFANFYPGSNTEIVTMLQQTVRGEGEKQIYLCGAGGQGLSHLLQACCHYAHQQHMTSVYLPLANLVAMTPEVLVGLETLNLICVDDLDAIAGRPEWEEAVFHFYNRVKDAGGCIIMSAHNLPKELQIGLPDLVSRLTWGIIYQLHPLNDEEKLAALNMWAQRRGIGLSEEVGRYVLTHCPRHMSTLFAALEALDKASLAAQRRLTIPFVKEILQI